MGNIPYEVISAHNAQASNEVARRRVRVAQLLSRKITQAEIAMQLSVDSSTISQDVAVLMEGWREAAQASLAEHLAKEIAELEQMERDCIVQFLGNQNPKWIQLRLEIKDKKYKLLGLYAPEKIANTNDTNGPDSGGESLRSRIDSIAARLRAGSDFTENSADTAGEGSITV